MTKLIQVRCYSCGESLRFDDSSCPKCSAMQVRLCECGATVSTHTDRCEECGAELDLLEYAPRRIWLRVLVLLLLVAGVCFGVYQLIPDNPARERRQAFVDASEAYHAGRYSEAHLKFRQFLRDHDRDPRALYMLGISLHRLGREDEAVVHASEALEIDPSMEEAAVYLANHEYSRGNFDAARDLSETVLEQNPKYVGAHEVLGKVLTQPGFLNVPRAVRHLTFAARNRAPGEESDPEVFVLLGELHIAIERSGIQAMNREGDSAEWIRLARESALALTDVASDSEVQFFLARCDYAIGEYGQAWIEIQKSLRDGESTPERRILEARLHYKRRNEPEAMKIVNEIAADSAQPETLLEIVAFCRDEGLDEKAQEILALAYRRCPSDVSVALAVANDLSARGKFAEAERELLLLRKSHPDDDKVIVALAEALFNQPSRVEKGESILEGQAEDAGPASYAMIRWIDRLLDAEPGSPEGRERIRRAARLLETSKAERGVNELYPVYMNFLLGKLYFRQHRYEDAREALRSVSSMAPDNNSAHRLLALIHRALGEPDLEALELSVIIRLEGESPDLLVQRAEAHRRAGNLRRAAADCRAALEAEPGHPAASVLLAEVLLSSVPAEPDKALACLRTALELNDAPLTVHIALAQALMVLGDHEAAGRELELLAEAPTTDEDRLLLVAARADLEDLRTRISLSPAARQIWTAHLDAHPESLASILTYARLLVTRGDPDSAEPWLDRAIEADPSSIAARRLQFELSFGSEDPADVDLARARRLAEEVRVLNPDSADVLYLEGKLALFASRDKQAASLLGRAFGMAPQDALIAYYSGMACRRIGDLAQARVALSRAVHLEPTFLPARLALANVAFEQGEALIANGKLTEATSQLQFTVQNSPDHMPARARLAEVFYQSGIAGDASALGLARQECEWLIGRHTDPTKAELEGVVAPAYLLLADICSEQGDLAGVLAACDRYLEIFPENVGTRLRKAHALLYFGENSQAVTLLEPLHAELPDDPRVLLALSDAYLSSDQPRDALLTVQGVLDRHPENASALYILGGVHQSMGSLASAAESFRRSLTFEPDLLRAADALTDLLLEAEREEELIDFLATLVERTQYRAEVQYLLARAHLVVSDTSSQGRQLLQEALRGGFSSGAHRLICTLVLLRIQVRDGDLASARALATEFSEWTRNYPGIQPGRPLATPTAEADFLIGLAFQAADMALGAEVHYRRAIQLAPDWAPPLVNLAELLRKDSNASEEALGLARRATELAPDSAEAWDSLGSVYSDQGFPSKAIAAYGRSIELLRGRAPDAQDSTLAPQARRMIAETYTRKAHAELDMGEATEARDSLRRAQESDGGITESTGFQAAMARMR